MPGEPDVLGMRNDEFKAILRGVPLGPELLASVEDEAGGEAQVIGLKFIVALSVKATYLPPTQPSRLLACIVKAAPLPPTATSPKDITESCV